MILVNPNPLPRQDDLSTSPWRAAVGGRAGALHVYAGPTVINGVGRAYMGLTVTMDPLRLARAPGGALMSMGVFLASRY